MSAPVPSPYRFTVSVEQSKGRLLTWRIVKVNDWHDASERSFLSEEEAQAHAALVLAALHQATMEET